jgi:hypothetical protein
MASREDIINALAQGRLPAFYFDPVAYPYEGSTSLPEGPLHVRICAPIGVEGEQHPLRLKGL